MTSSVRSGVVFAVLFSLWEGLTDGWDELTIGRILFNFAFFTVFMVGAGFLMRTKAPGQPSPGP